jgi:hypothetical protein
MKELDAFPNSSKQVIVAESCGNVDNMAMALVRLKSGRRTPRKRTSEASQSKVMSNLDKKFFKSFFCRNYDVGGAINTSFHSMFSIESCRLVIV